VVTVILILDTARLRESTYQKRLIKKVTIPAVIAGHQGKERMYMKIKILTNILLITIILFFIPGISASSLYGCVDVKFYNELVEKHNYWLRECKYLKAVRSGLEEQMEQLAKKLSKIRALYNKVEVEKEKAVRKEVIRTENILKKEIVKYKDMEEGLKEERQKLIVKYEAEMRVLEEERQKLIVKYEAEMRVLEEERQELADHMRKSEEIRIKSAQIERNYKFRLKIKEKTMEILNYLTQLGIPNYLTQHTRIFQIGGFAIIGLALLLLIWKREFVFSSVLAIIGVGSITIPQLATALFVIVVGFTMIILTLRYISLVYKYGIKAVAVALGYTGGRIILHNIQNYRKERV